MGGGLIFIDGVSIEVIKRGRLTKDGRWVCKVCELEFTDAKGLSDHLYQVDSECYCSNCHTYLADDAITWVSESRGEFWGTPCSERVPTGYTCQSCGYTDKL
jgi:rubredoxin